MITEVTDILVIGTGSAGYCSAIEAARRGRSVLLADKGLAGKSGCTVTAEQIAAVIPGMIRGDSAEIHYRDTLEAGKGLSDPALVRIMTEEAHRCIEKLERLGALFTRNRDGKYALDPMNGHSYPRSLYYKDITGKMIIDTLKAEAERIGVGVMEDVQIISLITGDNGVSGAVGLNFRYAQPVLIRARAVVLASGGAGELFPLSTNPVQSTGDGLILALKAGAVVRDIEFYQFYPVCLVYPKTLSGFVLGISQFGRLYNSRGERFMEKHDPVRMESATRDILSQAIFREIREGQVGPHGGVYLDATGLNEEIYEEYSDAISITRKHGIDLKIDRVEVRPAGHYAIGGIKINEKTETGVPGLFSAGEVTGGIHGANRLGNNSMLDTVVFGMRAGRFAAEYAAENGGEKADMEQAIGEIKRVKTLSERGVRKYAPWQIKKRLQKIMDEKVGIIKSKDQLVSAGRELKTLEDQLREETGVSARGFFFNRSLRDYLETANLLILARAIVLASLEREESRGAHFREDYPDVVGDEEAVSLEITLEGGDPVLQKRALSGETQ
ncbi:MAG: fumarate reductase/succinate dehydrogenase flavoprotein subunit [Spirochaetes bacterium]|nr:MAG: fumarate reductase/succinate dehydrogenase flavoprotein subunit [Spirochaetota bacterium]